MIEQQDFIEINQINGFMTFLGSIDWRDPWLIGLFTFHIAITMMALLTRNYGNFQALLFFILLLLVYFSESINEIASTNWKLFSRQQYFDSKGLFISVVFSIPILLNCMLMVNIVSLNYFALWCCGTRLHVQSFICCGTRLHMQSTILQGSWLYQSTQLMKNLKTAQLRERRKKERELENQKSIKSD